MGLVRPMFIELIERGNCYCFATVNKIFNDECVLTQLKCLQRNMRGLKNRIIKPHINQAN